MGTPVAGRAPSEAEKRVLDAAGTVGIAASLERIDTHAKFLLGLVTTFSGLLSLGGLFSLGDASLQRNAIWLALAFIPLAVSLACAVTSLTPRPYLLDLTNLRALEDHYRRMLRERGWMIALSGWLFAVSLASLPLLVFLGTSRQPEILPTLSNSTVTWVAGSEGVRTIAAELTMENLASQSVLTWTVSSDALGEPPIVYTSTLSAGPKVSTKVELPLPVGKEMTLRSELVVRSAGQELHRECAEFYLPPPQVDGEGH